MLFGEGISYADAAAQLSLAHDAGVNFVDTAEMYPVPQRASTQGRSEEYVGRWMRAAGVSRDRIIIATKVTGPSGQMPWIRGGPPALSGAGIRAALDGSLARLRTDYVDLYQTHWPDRYVPMFGEVDYRPEQSYAAAAGLEEQLGALGEAVAAGKVRHVGVSNETPYGLLSCLHLAQAQPHSFPRVVTVQNAYSLLCRTFDAGLAEVCHLECVSLLAYSPLAMGLLTGKYFRGGAAPPEARLIKYRGRYAEAECRYGLAKPNVREAVLAYASIAERHGLTPAQLALAFVLANPLVGSAIIDAVHARFPNPTP
eukprot:SM000003S11168  [mRNA]  locus=s3:1322521:1325105:- [translate_table: standard]